MKMTYKEAYDILIREHIEDREWTQQSWEAQEMLGQLVERHTPKKPAEYTLHTESDEEVHYEGCPSCKAILNKSHYFLKICHCGQKLDV